ncbi:hypothetical protein [Myxococcus stipitatus]|uniref:hypothetical protein n=1 Tax=Myxococcus stipitatus TaxID=83455 RepID=UPI0005C538C7|nr:hypothetical protein [Myxococcus stipitatus]
MDGADNSIAQFVKVRRLAFMCQRGGASIATGNNRTSTPLARRGRTTNSGSYVTPSLASRCAVRSFTAARVPQKALGST